jgi:hypothetical protein
VPWKGEAGSCSGDGTPSRQQGRMLAPRSRWTALCTALTLVANCRRGSMLQ